MSNLPPPLPESDKEQKETATSKGLSNNVATLQAQINAYYALAQKLNAVLPPSLQASSTLPI